MLKHARSSKAAADLFLKIHSELDLLQSHDGYQTYALETVEFFHYQNQLVARIKSKQGKSRRILFGYFSKDLFCEQSEIKGEHNYIYHNHLGPADLCQNKCYFFMDGKMMGNEEFNKVTLKMKMNDTFGKDQS